jgi:hypothetical protein
MEGTEPRTLDSCARVLQRIGRRLPRGPAAGDERQSVAGCFKEIPEEVTSVSLD